MEDSIRSAFESGLQVGSVLDVGILYGTEPLIMTCGHVPHHLFEPMDAYFEQVHRRYTRAGIDYELHRLALSDRNGFAWQNYTSEDGSGRITHSYLSDDDELGKNPKVVKSAKVAKSTLDNALSKIRPPEPYLLKIDVDGHEMNVLRGADAALEKTAMIVIESPLMHLHERSGFIMERGFSLFDIVGLSYYKNTLWQVDLVFIHQDLMEKHGALTPMLLDKHVDMSQFYTLSCDPHASFSKRLMRRIRRLKNRLMTS